jgi:branched-subunit amino acid transport protein
MDSIKMILVFYFKGIFASLITYLVSQIFLIPLDFLSNGRIMRSNLSKIGLYIDARGEIDTHKSTMTYFIFALPSRVFRLLGLCYSHILTASVVQEICTTHPKVLVHKQIEVPKNTNLKPLNTI